MPQTITEYNNNLLESEKDICNKLYQIISNNLPKSDNKIWHGHPVWFLEGNPIVGYSKQKLGIRLMFWSGADFEEVKLNVRGKKFKDASIFYNSILEIDENDLKRWLQKSIEIQWDYKNIVKRKGKLEKLENMNNTSIHDERIAKMTFASVYPHYVTKVEKKGRTKAELHQVIEWLTGHGENKLHELIANNATFETFFKQATLNLNAQLITGVICGYRVEEIKNPLTQKARYLDKLVDELAKGRKLEKIMRIS
ncbi:DUF2200 family protein [Candidatus Gracilibacteria bacterium]|nr:DUF2200 family protein [Candidatus Gracilibacteria bacterium]